MQHLEASGAIRPIYGSLDVKRLIKLPCYIKLAFQIISQKLACLISPVQCHVSVWGQSSQT